jgi:hypothetical protein
VGGRLCAICGSRDRKQIEEAILSGASVYELETQLGIHRSTLERHRRLHMQQVAEHKAVIVERAKLALRERKELAKAASADELPVNVLVDALMGVRAQALKMKNIEERLERVAAVAEADKAPQHVAALSGQQLRAVEVGSRLGQVGGYAQPRTVGPGGGEGSKFSITIMLGDDKKVSINATPMPQDQSAPEIEGEFSEASGQDEG